MAEGILAGRYRFVSRLGEGATGVVWLASDLILNRQVAIKRYKSHDELSEDQLARIVREAQTAAQLHHPNIVTVHDLLTIDGQPYVVMEFVRGESLAELVHREGRLAPASVAKIGAELTDALLVAHSRSILHRDIKPANILLDENGRAKLADFGLARVATDPAVTSTGVVLGTIAFLAPEMAKSNVSSFAGDVYSLGATLYTAVEGHPPHGAPADESTVQMLIRVVTEPIIAPSHAGSLTDCLVRMLATTPEERPSAREVRSALVDIIASNPSPARPADVVTDPVEDRLPSPDDDQATVVRLSKAGVDHSLLGGPTVVHDAAAIATPGEPIAHSPRRRKRRRVGVITGVATVVAAAAVTALVTSNSKDAPHRELAGPTISTLASSPSAHTTSGASGASSALTASTTSTNLSAAAKSPSPAATTSTPVAVPPYTTASKTFVYPYTTSVGGVAIRALTISTNSIGNLTVLAHFRLPLPPYYGEFIDIDSDATKESGCADLFDSIGVDQTIVTFSDTTAQLNQLPRAAVAVNDCTPLSTTDLTPSILSEDRETLTVTAPILALQHATPTIRFWVGVAPGTSELSFSRLQAAPPEAPHYYTFRLRP